MSAEELDRYRLALIQNCNQLEAFFSERKDEIDKDIWKLNNSRKAYADALDAQIKLLKKQLSETLEAGATLP